VRTLIANGTVVTHAGRSAADVLVDGERVVALAAPGAHSFTPDRVIDASGRYVMPGGVDAHTHMDLPAGGTFSADDFESGTRAAAWGGTTTIIDFAGQTKGRSMMEGFEELMSRADGRCAIDWGMHIMVTDVNDQTLPEMDLLMANGVTSFKLFMAYPGVLYSDDGQIYRAMQKAAEIGGMVLMHAENGIVIDVLRAQAVSRGDTDPIQHSLTRPAVTESEATHRAIAYAGLAGCPLYVVHMSAAEAVAEVRAARDRGMNVFGETCPQYLFLGRELLEGADGAKYVCSPPLRSRDEGHQEVLWAALATNDLQVVATDHCPFCIGNHPRLGPQKQLGAGDFTRIPNGLPGVEDRMPLLYDAAVADGRLTLERFVEVCSASPARIFGLYPRKGTIAVGSDADIVIWDPDGTSRLSADTHHMEVDYSAYEGREVRGRIDLVMSRGRVLIEGDEYLGKSGHGRYLVRDTNQYLI
jgi:dihydropyrimidinase